MAGTVVIKILADAKQATKEIKGVGDTTEKSSKKMAGLHKAGAVAGAALAGGLVAAGAAAVSFAKKASLDQQGASRLAQTLHKTTGATKEQQAAVEDWISAQEKALGVSDDDLRPALSKLAVATGSVAKAQKLAKLAMDISAGSGKSLASVSFALAKAQNGNVSGLSRLGVQTTKTTGDTVALEKAQTAVKSAQLSYTSAIKAHGKTSAQARIAADKLKQAHEAVGAAQVKTKKTTLSLDSITKKLSDQYGGAAAKNATTAAGKQKILQVQYQELQEQIGAALLPAMSKLLGIGLRVTDWISHNTTTVGIAVGVLAGLAAVIWTVSFAIKAWEAITKIFTAAQWLMNAALDANPIGLVVIAIAALVVGLVIAYKKSATFRKIVTGALDGAKAAVAGFVGFFTKTIPNAVSSVVNFVKSHWKIIASILGGPLVAAVILIHDHIGQIKDAISGVIKFITGLAGRFLTAGKKVGSSIIDGIKKGLSAVGGVASSIAAGVRGALVSVINDLINGLNVAIPDKLGLGKFAIHIPANPIPHLATGGIVNRPTLALIGEAGPEAVVPLSGRQKFGNTYNVTVQAAPGERLTETIPRALSILDLIYGG